MMGKVQNGMTEPWHCDTTICAPTSLMPDSCVPSQHSGVELDSRNFFFFFLAR